eukprot:scaffold2420_cov259-Pinguiococcus_pyrenoidosus.AAC.12
MLQHGRDLQRMSRLSPQQNVEAGEKAEVDVLANAMGHKGSEGPSHHAIPVAGPGAGGWLGSVPQRLPSDISTAYTVILIASAMIGGVGLGSMAALRAERQRRFH